MYLVQNSKSKKGSFMVKQKSVAFILVCSFLSPFSRGKTARDCLCINKITCIYSLALS